MVTTDDSAENWRSALENNQGVFNESELPWYSEKSPMYGPGEPTPAQIEAARRFVSEWLNGNSQGFIIPGNEWGRSLLHWLNILVARPAPASGSLERREASSGDASETDFPAM